MALRSLALIGCTAAASVASWDDAVLSYVQAGLPENPAESPLRYIKGNPEIVFAVATGAEHLADRAAGVIDTWCSSINACIFFSDHGNPTFHPAVFPLTVQAGERAGVDDYKLAQMRFLPILENMRILLTTNKYGLFSQTKWVALVDDDTYVFYFNLKNVLAGLDHTKATYTGNVIPENFLPDRWDGSGQDLGKWVGEGVDVPFVLGGGGSIFSATALVQMKNLHQCVVNQRPGQVWDHWQSDWMIGQCAHDAGINATRMTRGVFNQFVCSDEDHHVHFCVYGKDVDGELTEPATIHPIKDIDTMKLLREDYPTADSAPARDIVVEVNELGDLMRVLRRSEAEAYHAAKEVEARQHGKNRREEASKRAEAAEAAEAARRRQRSHGAASEKATERSQRTSAKP